MKSKSIFRIVMMMAILVIFTSALSAQHRPRRFRKQPRYQPSSSIGLRFGNDFKQDQYLAGAHFWLPVGIFWQFMPSADYYFTDDDTRRWQFNGDFVFKPRPAGVLYFGGGLAVQYLTFNQQTDVGGNVLVGLEFGGLRKPAMYPYLQARWTFLEDQEYFSLLGGINLMLR